MLDQFLQVLTKNVVLHYLVRGVGGPASAFTAVSWFVGKPLLPLLSTEDLKTHWSILRCFLPELFAVVFLLDITAPVLEAGRLACNSGEGQLYAFLVFLIALLLTPDGIRLSGQAIDS